MTLIKFQFGIRLLIKEAIKNILGKKSIFFIISKRKLIRENALKVMHEILCATNLILFSFRCKKINFLDQLKPVKKFKENDWGIICHPWYFKVNKKIVHYPNVIEISEINLYHLKEVIFTTESSNVLSNDKLIIQRLPNIHISISDYSTGFLKRHNDDTGLIWLGNNVVNLDIEDGYFLGGNGSWNYFHWITEILAKLEFIVTPEGFELCKNIIVSSKVLDIDSFKQTLEHALKGYNFVVYYIKPKINYRIPSLFLVNNPSGILFNPKGVLSRVDFSFYRKSSLNYVKNLFLDICDLKSNAFSGYDRVFLARHIKAARPYNQMDVESILVKKYGFTSIFIEDYSIEDQLKIFRQAKVIVGASGAAWTNIIFCNPDVLLISWLPTNAKSFSGYSSLAANFDLNMVFLEAEPIFPDQLHTEYKISCEELMKCIEMHLI
jgi:hypothetical protein